AAITAFSVKKGSTSAENYEFCAANTDGYLGAIERVDAVADGNNVSPRTGDTPVTFELLHEQVRLLAEIEGILTVSVNSKSVRCCRKKENLSIEIFFIRPAEDKKAIADTVRENLDNMLKLMKSSFNGRIAVNKKDLLEAVNRILICATAGGDIKRDYMLSMDMAFSGDSLK
ncbi:MAG: hypothetical protein GWO41_18195, partial [candidate division Zixibacteria bacterium]|nr:hypothetical protein [candidate division Zixibacteria bacterium]NIT54624.1 hypothetical protein [candidate division Zixibacteria bacterium]NIU17566.1 hypothetical protein [candidate division Zixibacteria bacterium]NIW43145.1 hypothetical protein [candidate division Zixibacteria bacterium]NIX55044.1 hypothetical protein [candidate division Zixibacteria bacterium]